LRDDFKCSMLRLCREKVDIFLGNHMQHNNTLGKAKRIAEGETDAFVNPEEWREYNLWCIEYLKKAL